MAIIGYPHSFLAGLSDFWQRFFSDSPQLEELYKGTAVLVGQAYLDLLSNVLSVSLKDTPIYAKEFYKLVTMREDELAFDWGASLDDDRWVFPLPDGLVAFLSLDNRVIEPTAALEERSDFDIDLTAKTIRFKQDPTDPTGDGTPLAGYARRALDVAVGGAFDDTTRPLGTSWMSRLIYKGDTLRLLDIGPDLVAQRKRSDHPIVLVREKALYVATTAPFTASTDPQSYVILRRPAVDGISDETLAFSGDTATFAHTRIDQGSVRVYAKTFAGADVVEGTDYTIDYELGRIYRNPVTWNPSVDDRADYTWQVEVWPLVGGLPPRYSATGVIRDAATTVRVVQMALWAPDAYVDRRTLANNFGTLIGREEDSSENYRAFLRGIFQLYLLGPVLERIESAINVIVGFPVIRDDGETLVDVDTTSDLLLNRVTTRRALNGILNVYEFPKAAPLRDDLVVGNYETLTFQAFEPLTTAVTVTDYVQSPDWWHNVVIPREMFSTSNGAVVPTTARRTVSPTYVDNIVGAADMACVGDPGLLVGADENGFIPAPGHAVFRHRLAYVLMDRFLKYHTFIVRFDPSIFSLTDVGYARSFNDLNDLILSSKPAHTYVFTQPLTNFIDTFMGADGDYWYQPAIYAASSETPEFFATEGEVTAPLNPYVQLGLFFNFTVASPVGGPDTVLFTDAPMVIGSTPMLVGDFFRYNESSDAYDFTVGAVAVPVGGTPPVDYTHRLIHVYVDGTIGGLRLVENVDYTVDYAANTATRITVWDAVNPVTVYWVLLVVGNPSVSPMVQADGDTALTVDGADPSTVTGDFDPAALNWMDEVQPVNNHRDLGMVERPLQLTVTVAT